MMTCNVEVARETALACVNRITRTKSTSNCQVLSMGDQNYASLGLEEHRDGIY